MLQDNYCLEGIITGEEGKERIRRKEKKEGIRGYISKENGARSDLCI